MKKLIVIVALVICGGIYAKNRFYDPAHKLAIAKNEINALVSHHQLKDGDLIFQTSTSKQSLAIQLATKSKYSHCGLIFKNGDNYFVFEAVQPVKFTPLDKWITKGKDGHYVIKRLKNADQVLNAEVLKKLRQECETFKGKSYDTAFEWTDDRIYCSELIWKAYQRATGIEIGKLEKLSNFNLTNKAVKLKLAERYGNKIPLNEDVISPVAIFKSDLLTTVKAN